VVPVGVEEAVEAVRATPEVEVVVDQIHRRRQETWLPRTPSITQATTTTTIII
jgi:hypothetical protein